MDTPLGIPKPNILALVSFDLPIARGDKIHCLDVLHSLTKYTLGFVDDGDEDFGKVNFFSLISHFVLKGAGHESKPILDTDIIRE